jgi:glyoxylase-like metal-dependent hydrolase (beta-lactamase superfamily II)
MQRRSFIRNASITAGALALYSHKLWAGFRVDDPWKIRPLRNNISIFNEKGGTIAFLVDKTGIVVVDAEFPEQAGHLIGELKKQSDKPVTMLINTHHHGDHTAGNIAFKGVAKNVAAHENSKANQIRSAQEKKTEDQQLYPDITYGDTWHYKAGGESIRTHYFGAAHTNGDSIIHFEHANIAHVGDLMFNRIYPFIDKTAGASATNWITVLDKTINHFDNSTLFVFGHGENDTVTGTKEDLKGMQNYLQKLLAYTSDQIKAGKPKEEIIKATEIPGVGEWKDQFNLAGANLGIAYDELTAKQ